MVDSVVKVVGGAIAGGAFALAVTWSGGNDLAEVQNKAEEIRDLAMEIVNEYEAVISDKQIEIQDIKDMYNQMEEKNKELQGTIDALITENDSNWTQANGYKQELEKANAETSAHKESMLNLLGQTEAVLKGGTN